jgi:hypothetical protein
MRSLILPISTTEALWEFPSPAPRHLLRSPRRLPSACASFTLAMLVSGCTWFTPDGGMSLVANIADRELKKDVVAIRSPDEAGLAGIAIQRLLSRTLTADAAVQIALLNNRGLQAAYQELAIADAERVGQSFPPNPTISISRIEGPVGLEIERRIITDILALATLPARSELAAARFCQAELRAAEETLRVAPPPFAVTRSMSIP